MSFSARRATSQDWPFVEALYARPHVVGQLHAPSEAEFMSSLERPGLHNLIIERDGQSFGNAAFNLDTDWLVNARALAMWEPGSGGGRYAMEHVISYAFQTLGVHRIFLEILESNVASRRLCETVGFHQEGLYRDGYRNESGSFQNLVPYGLLKSDLPLSPSA